MLAGALFYALVLVPGDRPALPPRARRTEGAVAHPQLRAVYAPALDFVLRRPCAAIAGARLGARRASCSTGASMGAEFLPRIFEGAYALDTLRPPSTT